MTSDAKTVEEYLASLPEDRRAAISAVRDVINKHLPPGYEEGMQYGAIGWYVPHSTYPSGYHCNPKEPVPYCGLASQKNHMGLYMFGVYISTECGTAFREEYAATGKKLDMGASCVRFRKLDQLPLELVAKYVAKWTVPEFLAKYEGSIPPSRKRAKK